ncbi:MAG: hypothetical protein ACRBCS_10115 [Cellvibrionaceae bacterium]
MNNPERTALQSKIAKNSHSLDIISAEDLISLWKEKTGKTSLEDIGSATSQFASPVIDSLTALKLVNDLGLNGKIETKIIKGKAYVIFKGYAGQRSIFSGTRYLANHPKVIDMAIGSRGVGNAVISGARLTIYLTIPLTIAKFILEDDKTMSRLIGTLATDIVKVGISTMLAGLTGLAVAAITTLAAGPLIAAIAVGVVSSIALNALDDQFQITEKLISAMEESYDGTFGAFKRGVNRLESTLRWQAINGVPVGKGIFY